MNARFTPSFTPRPLKWLLLATLLTSLSSSITGSYLTLSLPGIRHLFLWQFFTYPLIHLFPSAILHLAFNLLLIWTFGASLMERIRPKLFFILYFGAASIGGLCAVLAMALSSPPSPLFGSSPPLYALLTGWVLLNPESNLLLFFTFPCKARHLLIALIGLNLFIDLASENWIDFFAYTGAIFFGYLFTLAACRVRSPFLFLAPFERYVHKAIEKASHIGSKKYTRAKIYDIKSGEPLLNDQDFMDAMLARISLYGEEILTVEEKQRMQNISANKKNTRQKST